MLPASVQGAGGSSARTVWTRQQAAVALPHRRGIGPSVSAASAEISRAARPSTLLGAAQRPALELCSEPLMRLRTALGQDVDFTVRTKLRDRAHGRIRVLGEAHA